MKKLFLIALIFLSINSVAQFATMFNDTLKPFGIGGYDFNCIVQDDSFYYSLGGVNNTEPQWSNMIVKFDKYFNIVKKKKYFDTLWHTANYPYHSMFVNDEQILICPQITNKSYTAAFGKIVAINKQSLDTLWTKTIAHPDTTIANQPNSGQFSDLTAIKQTMDGGYILTGNYNKNCIAGNLRSFLLKIDSIGNVEWRRTYSQYYTFFDVELAADSGYYVPCTINNSSMVLVKFDKNGFYQWRTSVNSNTNPSYPMDVSIHGNHAIVSSVFWYDISNSLRAVTVAKADIINHNTMWEKNYYLYNSIECLGLHQAMGVESLTDGSIIVNGTVIKYGTDYSAFILKLNSNGDSLWTKTHRFINSNTTRSQLNDLLICDDGGFLGVGFYSPHAGGTSSAWMFKTDSNGVVGFESPKAKVKSGKLKVWPNPARDFTTISISQALNQESQIIIYNSLGQRVKTLSLQKQQLEIEVDVQGFSSGLYFFELHAAEGVLGVGKFVVE